MKLNACHNRAPFADSYPAQDGWFSTGLQTPDGREHTRLPIIVAVPHVMTKDCQYSIRTPDPKCTGCRWNQQEKQPQVCNE